MALRKEKLESYKKLLLARHETISHGLRVATAEFLSEEEGHKDSLDQAAADTDRNFAMQLKNRDRNTLDQIGEALRRIEDGVFGSCERCDESIAEARIKAFPFTTLCIDCKAEIESEEQRFPGRN